MIFSLQTSPTTSKKQYTKHSLFFQLLLAMTLFWVLPNSVFGADSLTNPDDYTCTGKATGISLISADSSQVFKLRDGSTVCLSDLPFKSGFTRIDTKGSLGSMEISVRGAAKEDNSQNLTPFDSGAFKFGVGTYKVTTTIYSERRSKGEVCDVRTFTFTIEDCKPSTCDGQVNGLSFISEDRTKSINIMDGQTICLGDINFTKGNVRVATKGTVGSMRIKIQGAARVENVDNNASFDSKTFNIVAGTYFFKAV